MSTEKDFTEKMQPYREHTVWASVQELLSDVLGALMPGIYFCFVLTGCIALFVFSICTNLLSNDVLMKIITSVSLEITICFFVCSYIIGSVFYRKDPKEPDKKSADYIYKRTSEKRSLAVQKIDNNLEVDFPYLFIYEYLIFRNLSHLASYIPWKGSEKKTHEFRTKMFINILKLRIGYYKPNCLAEIIKNEAHIRLMSSLYYAVKWIMKMSIFVLFIAVAISVIGIFVNYFDKHYIYALIVFSFVQFIISISIYNSIKKFFHYQRVREIVFVLEMAHIIKKEIPDIFDINKAFI